MAPFFDETLKYVKNTSIKVEFNMFSEENEFDPFYVTEKLKIKPTNVQIKGNFIWGSKGERYIETSWTLGTEREESGDIKNQFKLKVLLSIIIYVFNEDSPRIKLEREVVDFISYLGGEIESYVYVR